MTSLAVATAELRDAADELEDALSRWFDPTVDLSAAAERWWLARESYRLFLLGADV